jgi:hypothetical protein
MLGFDVAVDAADAAGPDDFDRFDQIAFGDQDIKR